MRLLKDNRGQIRVIEAFFASVLLLSSLTLIPMATQKTADDTTEVLSLKAQQVLMSLDSNGYLSNLIGDGNWTVLKDCVQSVLPLTLWFNLTVFNENMTQLNDVPICSGSAVSDEIGSTDYVTANPSSDYAVYIVRLQLAGVD